MALTPSAAMRWTDMPYLLRALDRTLRPPCPCDRVPLTRRCAPPRARSGQDQLYPKGWGCSDEHGDGPGLLPALLVEGEEHAVRAEHRVRALAGKGEVEPSTDADVPGLLLVEVDGGEAGARGVGDGHDGEGVG